MALVAMGQLVKHLRTQVMRGLPSEAEQRTRQQIRTPLESGAVNMTVFTTAPLHGNTYIFHGPGNAFSERRAYVGSTNLTNAGFFKNRELNRGRKGFQPRSTCGSTIPDRPVLPRLPGIGLSVQVASESGGSAESFLASAAVVGPLDPGHAQPRTFWVGSVPGSDNPRSQRSSLSPIFGAGERLF